MTGSSPPRRLHERLHDGMSRRRTSSPLPTIWKDDQATSCNGNLQGANADAGWLDRCKVRTPDRNGNGWIYTIILCCVLFLLCCFCSEECCLCFCFHLLFPPYVRTYDTTIHTKRLSRSIYSTMHYVCMHDVRLKPGDVMQSEFRRLKPGDVMQRTH